MDHPPLLVSDELLMDRRAHNKLTGRAQVMVIVGIQGTQYLKYQGPGDVLDQVHDPLARAVDGPLGDVRVGPTGVDIGGLVGQEGLGEVEVDSIHPPGVRIFVEDLEDSAS